MKVFLVLLSVSGEKVQGTGSLLTIPMKRSGALLQLSRGRPSQDNLICLDKFSQLSVSCYSPSADSMCSTLDNMLNTLGSEGGRFIARQSEVSRPTLNTVGNITDTITRKVDGVE